MINKRLKKAASCSLDITEQNIKKLKELFPEVLTEKKIDFDKLRLILGDEVETAPERYSFTWNGKRQAMHLAQQPTVATLKPNKSKSKNWDKTQNLYIEGDNLEVLKILQKSYANKIKMIYIDPPYNTGKDFVYRDNFSDSLKNYYELTGQTDCEGNKLTTNEDNNGRFHTDWLNMIYPRIKLAKNLLCEDGVMFVSIDDAEIDNMTKLIKELFGEKCYVMPLIWRLPRGINAGLISKAHEYVLVVTKSAGIVKHFNYLGDPQFSIDRTNKKIDGRHPASKIHFPAGVVRYEGKDKVITGEIPGSEKIIIHGQMIFKDGYLASEVDLEAGWTMKNMITDWLDGKEVVDSKGQKIVEFFFKENGRLYSKKDVSTQVVKSVLEDVPDNQAARFEIETLFGEQDIFSYPKPSGLIKYLASLVLEKDDILLDFFSGSGTTAQAVMQLNDEIKLNAKYILVQLPEDLDLALSSSSGDSKTTIENAIAQLDKLKKPHILTYLSLERILRASNLEHLDSTDVGFRVFELEKSNFKKWNIEPDDLLTMLDSVQENLEPGTTEDDLVYEIMLKQGLELTLPIEKNVVGETSIYKIAYGSLFIVLGKNITSDAAKKIIESISDEELEKVTIVLQDTGFINDSEKLNSIEILIAGGVENNDILSI